MNPFTLLMVMLILGVLALLGWGVGAMASRRQILTKADKMELRNLRRFYDEVDSIYMANRDVDLTAIELATALKKYRNRKELDR